jgi:hypothetical protein
LAAMAVTPFAVLAAVGIPITLATGQLAAASTILLGLDEIAVAGASIDEVRRQFKPAK